MRYVCLSLFLATHPFMANYKFVAQIERLASKNIIENENCVMKCVNMGSGKDIWKKFLTKSRSYSFIDRQF